MQISLQEDQRDAKKVVHARLSLFLYNKIQELAIQENRSVSAQVVQLITEALKSRERKVIVLQNNDYSDNSSR